MFDRHRQPWQCSVITDCGGKLAWFSQLAVPTMWWLLWGTADIKSSPRHSPERGGGGGAVVTND